MSFQSTFKHIMHLILAFSIILSWQVPSALARDITVIKTSGIKPYTEVLDGFKSFCDYNITEYNLSDKDDATIIRHIEKKTPDLIFTIGLNALKLAQKAEGVPIAFSMVSNPEAKLASMNNIYGISMNVAAKEQLSSLLLLLPPIRKIGIVYDPDKSLALYEEALEAAASQGIELVSIVITSSIDVPSAIKKAMHDVNAFWMVPDTTVIYPESLKLLMLTSFEKKVPILTFSDIYLEMGALVAMSIDTESIGRQACDLIQNILSGSNDINNHVRPPSNPVLSINPKRASEFDIDLSLTQKGSR
jgi:putative ABC transport system substrate-binding protein